ncbi:hypothetical protein Tco_0456531 [Tanacetum coccineum]
MVLNSPCFTVKSWLVQDQTIPDKSNPLIVDSLLKTIRLSIHLVVYNEELAIPEQTATGKGTSNLRKVELTNDVPKPPSLLKELITNQNSKSANFIDDIRRYNSMFAFTSMGGKQDTSVNTGRGPYCYRLHGENYHLAGPLLPETGKPAKFAQLYIFDTENEIQNRISTVSYGESSSSKNDQLDYKLT